MNKLIKDGKIFDLDKSTLIGTSQWFMSYGYKRRRFYKSKLGTFFTTQEETSMDDIRKKHPNAFFDTKKVFHLDIEPNEITVTGVITLEKARDMFEYLQNGGEYGQTYGDSFGYELHVKYEDLFELIEG